MKGEELLEKLKMGLEDNPDLEVWIETPGGGATTDVVLNFDDVGDLEIARK